MTSRTAVFTIVSSNYRAFAHSLMESVKAVHPEWHRHVLLVDRCDQPDAFGGALFDTTLVEQLPLPNKNQFLFRYDIMELNTAVKPTMFLNLRSRGYDRVVYLDPDILVIDRLSDVEYLLDDGASVVVTPHLTAPLPDDGCHPTEFDIMRAGSYNLGFLAVSAVVAADQFLAWWQQKLEFGAASDQDRGLFTDQKWVDLAPGLFPGFALLRDPGYNVAYWNLPHRPVVRDQGRWLAGGSPLRFFHFSGFDPIAPQAFSKHQNRVALDTIGDARELALDYAARVCAHGYQQSRGQPYAFGSFADGTAIPAEIRWIYRDDRRLQLAAGDNPFLDATIFIDGERAGLPVLLLGVWQRHPHVRRAFPDPFGSHRAAFCRWFAEKGAGEMNIPDVFSQPVKRNLARLTARADRLARAGTVRKATLWARGLVFLHKRVLGQMPSMERQLHYHTVTSFDQFLRVGFYQLKSARRAARRDFTSQTVAADNAADDVPDGLFMAQSPELPGLAGFHSAATLPPGVNLIGYARSEHGLGQSLRQCVAALDARAIRHRVIDFNHNNWSRTQDRSLDGKIVADAEFGINLFHINADQMPVAERHLPPDLFARFNIGFWHWELPELPDDYLSGFNRLNEVWVPSAFVQDAVAKKSSVPVVRMPHAIDFTVSTDASRARFGLPEDRFLFLTMFDFSSYQQRKNPQAALAAFDLAFGSERDMVGLVIKTQNAQFHEPQVQILRAELAGRDNIFWINETLSREEIYDLQSVCDAMLSLHRSEGFGLGPAESMFLGKPVIATNWSGNTEFMQPHNSLPVNYRLVNIAEDIGVYRAGQIWAEPDIDHAASLARQLFFDVEMRDRIGSEARRTMREAFSPEVIGRRIEARLRFIQDNLLY